MEAILVEARMSQDSVKLANKSKISQDMRNSKTNEKFWSMDGPMEASSLQKTLTGGGTAFTLPKGPVGPNISKR